MRTSIRIAAIVFAVYLVITLVIISPALNFLPHHYIKDSYGWNLQTRWVLLNPFKLSLDIREATLDDKTGETFVGFEKFSLNLSLQSLWRSGWVLDALHIRGLNLNVTRVKDDEYNFSSLLPAASAEQNDAADTNTVPGITIGDLKLQADTITLTDETREKPYSSRWSGLHVHVSNLSTVAEEGRPYTVALIGEGGGTLKWEGEVSLPNGSSHGRLAIANLNLRKIWEFAEPWLRFELQDGRLAVDGQYTLDWSDQFSYSISKGHIGLSVIDIIPIDHSQKIDTAVALKSLSIDNIELDSDAQHASIEALRLDGLALATWLDGNQLSLQQLFTPNLPASPADTAADESATNAAWTAVLKRAQLNDGSLRWRSDFTDPATLEIQPITAKIENLQWPLSEEITFALNLTANKEAEIGLTGKLALASGNGSMQYTLNNLPLTWFNPNLPTALKAAITGGKLQTAGQLQLREYAPLTVALDGEITDFSARREGVETTLTGWDSVRVSGLAVDLEQRNVVLNELAINHYTGRLHISEDGTINASNIWQEDATDAAQPVDEQPTEDTPWSFSIPSIQISDSEIDYMDQSLPIQFRTVIGQLDGEVRNLSSAPGQAAKVDIQGSVDGYAPVTLKGAASPFLSPPGIDLNLTFEGVDMAGLSPYSGTYAGYAIQQGLLYLDLSYTLKDNHLQGDNAIKIDKLKLGQKVSSEKAVNLPLELALAILTDSQGVIDMQVPVTGDVDNPSFGLGSVIANAFINIITKAVTAPFSLLANLVGSDEDLQTLSFAPGSAELSEANVEKLELLTEALQQRPQLSLLITGHVNPATDRARMQQQTLDKSLLQQGLSQLEIETKEGSNWTTAVSDRYKTLSQAPADPVPTAREQYQAVAQSIAIPDSTMLELGQQRAVMVKRYLLNKAQLEGERTVIGQTDMNDKTDVFSGVELSIKN